MMPLTWDTAAIWMGMALLASLISVRIGISVALVEICVGIVGGNVLAIQPTPWIASLAGFGSVVLTFLAGAEIDLAVMKNKWKETLGIGLASFAVPCLSVGHRRDPDGDHPDPHCRTVVRSRWETT
jgi:Kef-type K+ transport system membrane component KefB